MHYQDCIETVLKESAQVISLINMMIDVNVSACVSLDFAAVLSLRVSGSREL